MRAALCVMPQLHMKNSAAQYTIVILVMLSVAVITMVYANHKADALENVQSCVVQEAQEQGYTGNPYSEEAWRMFAPDCN